MSAKEMLGFLPGLVRVGANFRVCIGGEETIHQRGSRFKAPSHPDVLPFYFFFNGFKKKTCFRKIESLYPLTSKFM